MKKLLVVLLGSLILLTGCKDGYASISNGSEVVMTVGDQTLTKDGLYTYMVSQDVAYDVVSLSTEHILDIEVAATQEMIDEVDEQMEYYASIFGDYFEVYIMSNGFSSLDSFRDSLIYNQQLTELTKKYIQDNFDEVMQTYAPKKIYVASFTDYETAEAAQQALVNGQDFIEVANEYGSTSSIGETIATSESTYPTGVLYVIASLNDGETSDVVANDDETTFYVVQMINSQASDFEEEALTTIAGSSTINNEAILHYFSNYKLNIYDKQIYDAVNASYPDYLK